MNVMSDYNKVNHFIMMTATKTTPVVNKISIYFCRRGFLRVDWMEADMGSCMTTKTVNAH